MALNGISTLISGDGSDPDANKLSRRDAKLALAATERQDVGNVGYRQYNTIVGVHDAYVNGNLNANVSGTTSPTTGHPWSL